MTDDALSVILLCVDRKKAIERNQKRSDFLTKNTEKYRKIPKNTENYHQKQASEKKSFGLWSGFLTVANLKVGKSREKSGKVGKSREKYGKITLK